jgi:hypothetical protein
MGATGTKRGRPSKYTKRIGWYICERIARGEYLVNICRDEHLPHERTVYRWLLADDEAFNEFRHAYTRAREIQRERMAEQILTISDDGTNDTYVDPDGNTMVDHDHIQRSKLRVDTRKWILSRLDAAKYGQKATVEHHHSGEVRFTHQERVDRINELLQLAQKRAAASAGN